MISKRRKAVYFGSLLLMLFLVIEAMSALGYRVVTGEWLSFEHTQGQRMFIQSGISARLIDAEDRGPVPRWQVLHPYLGFVLQPSKQTAGSNDRNNTKDTTSSNDYGFTGALPPFVIGQATGGRDANQAGRARPAVVAVVGGSVAQRLVDVSARLLERELAKSACFAGRAVEVVNLALPGVKQPQQLLTLDYFLSVGAVIDVLISLDGFNEVVLPIAENEAQGVFPFYPRNWKFHVAGLQETALMVRVGEVEFWRSLRKSMAAVFSGFPLRYSPSANTLWVVLDHLAGRSISLKLLDLTLAQARVGPNSDSYLKRGPTREYASKEAQVEDLVGVWERSTELMHGSSRAAGIASFHFLQPNQRVEGSKVFAPGERAVALPERHGYDASTRQGYPGLIAGAERMRAKGIPFDDLTMVFADIAETIYIDGCCHVNTRGSRLMTLEIARIIRERFAAGEPCPEFR